MLKRNSVKIFLNVSFAVLLALTMLSCSSTPVAVGTIRLKGSETMLQLTEMLAAEYMKLNPGVSVYVEGGGTASGVRALIRNEVDICTASRNLKYDEVKILADQYKKIGISYIVAKDALSIYLNPDNPVNNLTMDDLKKIFTCKATNWKTFGGNDDVIQPVIRNPNSGTYLYLKEHVLQEDDYCDKAETEPTMNALIEAVADNVNAVGYGGIGLAKGLKHIKVNGVAPMEENVRNGKYPIIRYLHFYVLDSPEGIVKKFIDWVLSPEGQQIVEKGGYIPLFEISY